MDLTRDAWPLLTEYTKGESLLKHALARRGRRARLRAPVRRGRGGVGHRRRCCTTSTTSAGRRSSDHPYRGQRDSAREGLSRVGDPRDPVARRLQRRDARQPLEKTLFACDEMAGFVTAASLVRPSKSVLDLEAKSVVKRMKDKAFARGVKREDLRARRRAARAAARGAHRAT